MQLALFEDTRDGRGESERQRPCGSENRLAFWKLSHECCGCLLVEFAEGVVEKQQGSRAHVVCNYFMRRQAERKRDGSLSALTQPAPCIEVAKSDRHFISMWTYTGGLTFEIVVPCG
jgi:hypothetical protein